MSVKMIVALKEFGDEILPRFANKANYADVGFIKGASLIRS